MKAAQIVFSALLLSTSAAFGSVINYSAFLDGPSESPPNASPGTGFAQVVIDDAANTMSISVSFSGLLGTTTASHIHCCTAVPGVSTATVATVVPTFPGFPLGVTSGTYSQTFDLTLSSSYNPTFITNNGGTVGSAEAALLAGMAAGKSYLNIHTSVVPGGEIRGFLEADAPEPGTLGLLTAALGGIALLRRRKPVA